MRRLGRIYESGPHHYPSEVEYRRGLILTDLGRLREAKEALRASMTDEEEDVSKMFGYAAVLMQSE